MLRQNQTLHMNNISKLKGQSKAQSECMLKRSGLLSRDTDSISGSLSPCGYIPSASHSNLETSPSRLAAVCGMPNYSTLRFSHLVASFLFMKEGLLMISVIIIIISTSKVAPPRNAENW